MRQYRLGIVGLGMAASKHALALAELRERAEIVAAWSPTAASRAAAQAAHGMPVVERLEAIRDDARIDLVLILSPPWTHLELVRCFAGAGKHILLEKPIEADAERAGQAVAACRDAGVTLGVVFQNRFRRPYLQLEAMIRGGRLGGLVSVSASARRWRPASYFAEKGRGMRVRDGGGVLLTQAIHTLDQVIGLAGPIATVAGFHANSGLRAVDTEDVAAAALRWTNGAIGVFDATTASFPDQPERIEIAGTLGSAVLERSRLRLALHDGTRLDELDDAPGHGGVPGDPDHLAHRRLIEAMLDALDAGRAPAVDGAGSLAVHRTIAAMLRAGASGRAEQVEEDGA